MPTVSGPAILSRFDPGGGNVALVGIGQGIEARLLIERLDRNRAVFALEQDPTPLWLVLHVHDFAAAMEQGRLVPIMGEDPGEALVRFLRDHEGYLAPERMLSWPWFEPQELGERTLLLQRALAQTNRHRSEAMMALTEELNRKWLRGRAIPERPRTLLVCPHAGGEPHLLAGQVLSGLTELGWAADAWFADSPRTVHPLALGRRIAEFQPDLVIAVDGVRAGLGHVLPAGLSLASWMTPSARPSPNQVQGIGPHDRIFCMTGRVMKDLVACGAETDRVRWLPPAVHCVAPPSREDDRMRPYDIAALANASPLAPEANGLTLESHCAAWREAERVIRQQAERYTDDHVEHVLRAAEATTGARFTEAAWRRALCDQINAVLGRTLVSLAVFEAVLRSGLKLALWGRGWEQYPGLSGAWQGPIPNQGGFDVCRRAKLVLHVDVTGNLTMPLLSAAAAGAVVLARHHPTDQEPTGLSSLLTPGHDVLTFLRYSELIGHAKRLLSDEAARRSIADRARTVLTERHLMRHRLTTLRTLVAEAREV